MKNVLEIKNHQYNFRRDFLFRSPSLEFSTCKFECSKSFNEFDKNNRKFTSKDCPCKVYVQNL